MDRIETNRSKIPEFSAILFWLLGQVVMLFLHEPWFDEALAWLIARDSSLKEILFVAPHYEGHPSLWHLVLYPLAKVGMPYELSLSIVSLFFSGTAVILFVYKSPFKRIIRLIMPFTYFVFYQYSVISRPYCMMMLAFVLVALTYKDRDSKPGKFILSLWFLCLTSAYGIVIAGGICIVWIVNMVYMAFKKSMNMNSQNGEYRGTIKILFQDYLLDKGKLIFLIALLFYVLFILYRIIPVDNAYAVLKRQDSSYTNSFIIRLIYTLFFSISDLFITNVYSVTGTLMYTTLPMSEYIVGAIIGLIIICAFFVYLKKDIWKLLTFLIPYLMFSVFGAMVYFYDHHIGIYLLLAMVVLWNSDGILIKSKNDNLGNGINIGDAKFINDENKKDDSKGVKKENNQSHLNFYILIKLRNCCLAMMLIIPLYWGIGSGIVDVFYDYGSGKIIYSFLKDNNLEDSVIYVEPCNVLSGQGDVAEFSEKSILMSYEGINIAPYLSNDAKIIGVPKTFGLSYTYTHMILSDDEKEDMLNNSLVKEQPDVLLGLPSIDLLPENIGLSDSDYVIVFQNRVGNIKKAVPGSDVVSISVRKDIVEEKGLKRYNTGR